MNQRRSTSNSHRSEPLVEVTSLLAALAAAFAPASLVGVDAIDLVQRVLLTGFVAWVGSHGRRWTWLVAALVIAVPARGASLTLTLVALVVFVVATVPKHRPRLHGALGGGLLANAVLWYPPTTSTIGAGLGIFGLVLFAGAAVPRMRRHKRKVVKRILAAVAVVVVLAGLGAGVAMLLAYSSVRSGSDAAQQALDAARDGDGDAAAAGLAEAQDAFERAYDSVGGPLALPGRLVPGLAQQLDAVRVTVEQGRAISATGDDLVATADYDTLKYQGRLDVQQVAQLAGPADRADRALSRAVTKLDEVRSSALVPPLRDRLDEFVDQIDEAHRDTRLAADLLRVTPGLFGNESERRYLVIFVTPAELRGAGGFVGSYAELRARDGKVELTRSGSITDLINAKPRGTRRITGPRDYLLRYGRTHPEDDLQDVTSSPNFPSSASVMAQLYPQSGGSPVDGVISVDPTGLAALLTFTGPIAVEGLQAPLTSANAVDVLTKQIYIDVPDNQVQNRILADATKQTFQKLIESSLPSPRKLATTLSPATRSGHLRLWSPKAHEQEVFAQVGATGELTIPPGHDGFSVTLDNVGNNKIDAYLHRSITYRATVDAATGRLTGRLHIELRNDVPSVDLPPAVVGNTRAAPVGTNVAVVSLFTPHAVTSAFIDSKQLLLGPGFEHGLNAWDTPVIQIPPGRTVVIDILLAGGVDLRDGYVLDLLPQPVANADTFRADLTIRNGRTASGGKTQVSVVRQGPITAPTSTRVALGR